MIEAIEIKGGAGEMEAAVIAVVIDRITQEEKSAREGRLKSESVLPAWIRALHPTTPKDSRWRVWPE